MNILDLPNSLVQTEIFSRLTNTEDMISISLVCKEWKKRIEDIAQHLCMDWWKKNLIFQDVDIAESFPIDSHFFTLVHKHLGPLINWCTLWACLAVKRDMWSLPEDITFVGHDKTPNFITIGRVITECTSEFWPGALWRYEGPHIKIDSFYVDMPKQRE